jgi:hypothetical protein
MKRTKLVEQATQRHTEESSARLFRQEHQALLKENLRLQKTLETVNLIKAPSKITIYSKSPRFQEDAVACALASDWHMEERVEAHTVHGINEYNPEIAALRAKWFFQNYLRMAHVMARDCKIKRLYIFLGGDLITNYIHEELRELNYLPPAEAANFVLEQLCKGFDFLLKESSFHIEVDAVPGNHGRMTAKPRIQNATGTSLETFMYRALARRYEKVSRLEIRVAESKMIYRKFHERFILRGIHGDDIKFGGGIGGITIPIRKKLAAWDKAQPANLTIMGHFHQRMDGGDFLVNGSLIGYNEFAQAIGASPEEPQQQFFLIHARNGGEKSVVAPIWLNNDHHKKPRGA